MSEGLPGMVAILVIPCLFSAPPAALMKRFRKIREYSIGVSDSVKEVASPRGAIGYPLSLRGIPVTGNEI